MSDIPFEDYPQLDVKILFQIRSDLGDEFSRFLNLFTEHSQYLLTTIHDSLTHNDLEQAKIALHSFKGMSGTMGAMRLFHLCQQAEKMASTGQLQQHLHLITAIENTLPDLHKTIEKVLKNQ